MTGYKNKEKVQKQKAVDREEKAEIEDMFASGLVL